MMFHNIVNKMWVPHASREEKQVNHKLGNQNRITSLNGDDESDKKGTEKCL